jgi:hypothetical protein
MTDENIFSTRDLTIAAALLTHRFIYVGIDIQIEGHRGKPVGYFKFENTPELQEARARFARGDLMVEPKSFMTNVHALKSEVVNIYKNPHIDHGNN